MDYKQYQRCYVKKHEIRNGYSNHRVFTEEEAAKFIYEILLPLGLEEEYGKDWKNEITLPEEKEIMRVIDCHLRVFDGEVMVVCEHFGQIHEMWNIQVIENDYQISSWFAEVVPYA